MIPVTSEEFLGTVNTDTVSTNKPWMAVVLLKNRGLVFKVDTARHYCDPAECVPPRGRQQIGSSLNSSNGLTGKPLDVCDRFKARPTKKGVESQQ